MSEENKKLTKSELKDLVKRKKKKKIILVSCISAGVILLALILGLIIWQVTRIKPVKRTDEQGIVVGKIGEYEIYNDEFSYLLDIYKKNIEYKYGKIDWSDGSEFTKKCLDELEEDIIDGMMTNYAVFEVCKDYGIDADSREINKLVNEKIKEIIDDENGEFKGDKGKYVEYSRKGNESDAYIRIIAKAAVLEEKIIEKLRESGEIEYVLEKNLPEFITHAKESDTFVRTTHVFYPKFDVKGVDIEEVRAEASEIAANLKSISDDEDRYDAINKAISKCPYNTPGYTMANKDGIYFTEGMMGEVYESTARALDEYGTSDAIETDEGFYVIMRLPLDTDYVGKNAETLLENYSWAKLALLERDAKAELLSVCDDFSGLIYERLTK